MPPAPPDPVCLRGRVMRGRGGVAREDRNPRLGITRFFGEAPCPGTLNVALDAPVRFDPEQVELTEGGLFSWRSEIDGIRCLIVRGRGFPLHVVELHAVCKLRDALQLQDGSPVDLRVPQRILAAELDPATRRIWTLFWRGRETWYGSKLYRKLIAPFWWIRRRATQVPQYHVKSWRTRRAQAPVCHINLTRSARLRGGERQTEILIRALAEQGVPTQRAIVHRAGGLARALRGIPGLRVRRVPHRLAALAACRGTSLLHAHEAKAAQVACLASRLWGCRYLITRRMMRTRPRDRFTVAVHREADRVVVLTQAVEENQRESTPDARMTRIPDAWNPVDMDPAVAEQVRARFPGKFIVGHTAAMDLLRKRHDILIEAARALEPEFPDILFLLLGSGRHEADIHAQAEGLGNVHFAGWVEDPISWLPAFDLFAFPSVREPLGSSLLDTLRAGVPIIACRDGGIPEVITEDCGILIPPNDAPAMAEQITRLYRDADLRDRLAWAGKARAEQFSPARIAAQYQDVYRDIGERSP